MNAVEKEMSKVAVENEADRIAVDNEAGKIALTQRVATGQNVIIEKARREDRTESGMLHLPDVAQQRSGEAVVLSVGPKCWRLLKDASGEIRTVRPGDKIRYHPLGQVDYVDENVSIIREQSILVVIEA